MIEVGVVAVAVFYRPRRFKSILIFKMALIIPGNHKISLLGSWKVLTSTMPTSLENKTALLVDDRREILMALELSLKSFGMTTVSVTGGHEALKEVRRNRFDLIILDVDMPGMSGFQVCHELKNDQETANIPVIFFSGKVGPAEKNKAETLGHFLAKPADLQSLKAAIQKALQKTE